MARSYLQFTNRVLRRFGEVELTAANFAADTGFHAFAKDTIDDAIQDINE